LYDQQASVCVTQLRALSDHNLVLPLLQAHVTEIRAEEGATYHSPMPSAREEARLADSSILLPAAAEANVGGSVEGMVVCFMEMSLESDCEVVVRYWIRGTWKVEG
jgi:hypothetical protein